MDHAGAGINDDSSNPSPSPSGSGKIVDNSPVAIVIDGPSGPVASYTRPTRSRGSGSQWTCHYYEAVAALGVGAISAGPDKSKPLPTLELNQPYWLECVDQNNEVVYSVLVTWDPTNPLAGIAVGPRAAEQAAQTLPLPAPTIHTNPPENTSQLVGLESWFHVDTPWQPTTATATITAIAATVTATPTNVTWDFGDGSPIQTCSDPGKPFTTHDGSYNDPYAGMQPCTHTYDRRSTDSATPRAQPDGTFTVTATVTYNVTWTATDGTTGTLDPITRTGQTNIRVLEAQALIE